MIKGLKLERKKIEKALSLMDLQLRSQYFKLVHLLLFRLREASFDNCDMSLSSIRTLFLYDTGLLLVFALASKGFSFSKV